MADGESTTDTTTTDDTGNGGGSGKTYTQEQVNQFIAREKGNIERKYSDYDDIKAKAGKYDELEEQNKTEKQRLEERAATAESAREAAELAALRYSVAADKGVPLNQAHRLQGQSKEDLEKDAETFVKDFGGQQVTDFDAGSREQHTEQDMNSLIRQSAGRGS